MTSAAGRRAVNNTRIGAPNSRDVVHVLFGAADLLRANEGRYWNEARRNMRWATDGRGRVRRYRNTKGGRANTVVCHEPLAAIRTATWHAATNLHDDGCSWPIPFRDAVEAAAIGAVAAWLLDIDSPSVPGVTEHVTTPGALRAWQSEQPCTCWRERPLEAMRAMTDPDTWPNSAETRGNLAFSAERTVRYWCRHLTAPGEAGSDMAARSVWAGFLVANRLIWAAAEPLASCHPITRWGVEL